MSSLLARRSRPALIACALLGVASSAFGQLEDWAAVPVNAPTIKLEQSIQYTLEGNVLRAFSGVSRQWSTLKTVFGAPAVFLMNEHLIAQDGPFFYGYCARSSRFTPLFPLSGTASLLPPTSGQTWQSVVLDGNDVHMYSAYTGEWYSAHFNAPPNVSIKNMTVLIDDGTTIFGMSPLYGTPVALAATGATIFGEFGGVGIATSSGQVHGYSAHNNTWESLSVATTPSVSNGFTGQPAFVAIQDGTSISFFSGQSGTFTTLPAAPSASVFLHRSCAIVLDGSTVYGYSGLRGDFQALNLAVASGVTMSHFFALVSTPTQVYGYSADSNAFSAPLAGSFAFTLGQTAAFAESATPGPGAAYSSLTNQWVPAPIANASIFMEANAAVLVDPAGGMYGIAPRDTTWEFQSTAPLSATYQANTPQGPGMFVGQDGNDLYAFNSRSGHWRVTTTATNVTTFKGHWGAAILEDGVNAYAYGEFNDRWSTIPLIGPVLSIGAQVESAQVRDGNELVGYSAFGQLVTSADYPEYWRGVAIGGHLQLDLVGEPNSSAILFLGLPGELPTPYGTLGVTPATFFIFAFPTIALDGRFSATLTVPNNPVLTGANVNIQAAITGPLGIYLTNAVNTRIL